MADNQNDVNPPKKLPTHSGGHPAEKPPLQRMFENLNPNTPPDQKGTTSQGWSRHDTKRRNNFNALHGTTQKDFDDGDAHPTDPNYRPNS